MTESELKEQLQPIAANEYKPIETGAAFALAQAMLPYIGTTDPELRDGLIYMTMAYWLVDYDMFDDVQRHALWEVVLDEQHLFYGLGEKETDSIFMRSFSVLWLPILLISHRKRPYLSPTEVHQTKEAVIRYLQEEEDLRGYDAEKGWLHGVAHSADALDDLALCTELGRDDLEDILNIIHQTMTTSRVMFAHGEEERMVIPVVAVLSRDVLPDEVWQLWIDRFVQSAQDEAVRLPQAGYSNLKNFLYSLYLHLYRQTKGATVQNMLLSAFDEINPL